MAQIDDTGLTTDRRYRFASPHGLLYATAISAVLWGGLTELLIRII